MIYQNTLSEIIITGSGLFDKIATRIVACFLVSKTWKYTSLYEKDHPYNSVAYLFQYIYDFRMVWAFENEANELAPRCKPVFDNSHKLGNSFF